MWMRNVGGHTRSNDASGQLKTQSNRYVLQMGGDIARWSNNDRDRLHLGIMAGYGNNKSNTRSSRSGYSSDGTVDGYSVGAYGTWYANDEDKSGLYVDSWAQYSLFNNTVSGEGLSSEKYKSKGMTASLEVDTPSTSVKARTRKRLTLFSPRHKLPGWVPRLTSTVRSMELG